VNLQQIIQGIEPVDEAWRQKARDRSATLLMPFRALGRLLDMAEQLCAIQRTLRPTAARKAVLVMAGDHGVTAEGVSPYPREVTPQMVGAFLRGWAGINALAGWAGAEVRVADLGVAADLPADDSGRLRIRKIARGTANLAQGPAMRRDQAEAVVVAGFELASELFAAGVDVLATGDMGIGNTTPSAALGCVFTGLAPEVMVGPGAGLDDAGLVRKREVVRRALAVNAPDPADGLDALAKVGGFEIGGLAGLCLAAAHHKRVAMVDGFIATAGALVAQALCPAAAGYMLAGHSSAEPGHQAMLARLGLRSILQLDLRLGEGTGAALAMGILDAAVKSFNEMATFEDAGVSKAE